MIALFGLGPGQSWLVLAGPGVPLAIWLTLVVVFNWLEHEGMDDVEKVSNPVLGVGAAVIVAATFFSIGAAVTTNRTYRTAEALYGELRHDPQVVRVSAVDVRAHPRYGDARVWYVDHRGYDCAGVASHVGAHWYLHHRGKARPVCYSHVGTR